MHNNPFLNITLGLQHGGYNTPARDYRPIGDAREIAMDGNHMTLNIAGYFQNSNNLEDIGSLGRENIIEIMDMLKGFAKAEGAEKVTIKYERSAGSTASKAGNAFERTFNLTD